MRSLSLGFGARNPHGRTDLPDEFYGEWEIGTYTAAWRVIDARSIILCGSGDVVDSLDELDTKLHAIELGRISDILVMSRMDIQVSLEGGVSIQFLGSSSDDDEMFHIFGPQSLYVEYKIETGWQWGRSDMPWQ